MAPCDEMKKNFVKAGLLFGCAIGAGIVPAAIRSDERVSLFRAPCAAPVTANPVMVLEDSIHHFPCGFNGVFAGEERPVALHGISQKPFVRRFLARLLI